MITEKEQQAYRLCHHDFAGLTVDQAANRMKVSARQVQKLLKSLEKKAPQLFPILSAKDKFIVESITEKGYTYAQISEIGSEVCGHAGAGF